MDVVLGAEQIELPGEGGGVEAGGEDEHELGFGGDELGQERAVVGRRRLGLQVAHDLAASRPEGLHEGGPDLTPVVVVGGYGDGAAPEIGGRPGAGRVAELA